MSIAFYSTLTLISPIIPFLLGAGLFWTLLRLYQKLRRRFLPEDFDSTLVAYNLIERVRRRFKPKNRNDENQFIG
jgi:hypothetical protein